MGSMLDPLLIGEISLVVTAASQLLKSKKGIKGSVIQPLSGLIAVVAGIIWYLVNGGLHNSDIWLSVDWPNIYRGIVNGAVAAVAANSAYIAQKNLPGFNILPTASEMRQAAIREEEEKQELIVEAVTEGVPPEKAKEALGVPQSDPPPNEELEQIKPELPSEGEKV